MIVFFFDEIFVTMANLNKHGKFEKLVNFVFFKEYSIVHWVFLTQNFDKCNIPNYATLTFCDNFKNSSSGDLLFSQICSLDGVSQ